MNLRHISALALMLYCFGSKLAPSCGLADCTSEHEAAGEKSFNRVNTWGELRTTYKNFEGCENGELGEAVSDFVVHHLASHWNELSELNRLVLADSQFHSYVLAHIDATTDSDDINRVLDNAKRRCPAHQLRLCRAIEHAAAIARQQMDDTEN